MRIPRSISHCSTGGSKNNVSSSRRPRRAQVKTSTDLASPFPNRCCAQAQFVLSANPEIRNRINRVAASRLFELSQILDVPPAYFFDGLHDNANAAPSQDHGMEIVSALAAIKDEDIKSRIVTFIEDVSGVTVARQG